MPWNNRDGRICSQAFWIRITIQTMGGHAEYWFHKVKRPAHEKLKKEGARSGDSATGKKYGVSGNAVKKWLKS